MLLGGKQPNSLMVANVTIISHTECKKVRKEGKEETVYFCICVCYCTHKIQLSNYNHYYNFQKI